MFRARLSISEVHFLMMKGMPSGLFLATWAKSIPNRCSLPWSFLWPHWMARVSRHFLWQAKEHYVKRDQGMTTGSNEQCEQNRCGCWWRWPYLLTFSALKHHQPVTLSAFRRCSQFPQLVSLCRFWHQSITKRAGRTGRFHHHFSQAWDKKMHVLIS